MSSHFNIVQRMGRHWMVLGLNLGYPPCCIAAFVRGEQLARDYVAPPEYDNTGFRPCRDCALVKPELVIAHINAHRSPKLRPFPDERMVTQKEVDKVLEG